MKPTSQIRQMEANARAAFKAYQLPCPACLSMLSDRVIYRRTAAFMRRLAELVPVFFETWPFNRNHGATAVAGWRERVGMCSMQIVEHDGGLIEVDFDLANPNHGLAFAIGHLVEILTPGKTDAFKVMKGLRKRHIEVPDVRKEIQA